MMKTDAAVIGGGIVGLSAALMLRTIDPNLHVTVFDGNLQGATFGAGSNARHFTGTEGLSLQNPIHSKAVFIHPENKFGLPGWQTIPEENLTVQEKQWRKELVSRYDQIKEQNENPYDLAHAVLNYGGISSWELLVKAFPKLEDFKIADDVLVLFETEEELLSDFAMESGFDPLQRVKLEQIDPKNQINDLIQSSTISKKCLRVPGSSWRIQSVGRWILERLNSDDCVEIIPNRIIETLEDLPQETPCIWALGANGRVPLALSEKNRIQGVGGFWVTIPNRGIRTPFKIRAPQPSGYINFTPDGELIHISGGFGWIGGRSYEEGKLFLESTQRCFIQHLAHFTGISVQQLIQYDVRTCIRPTTPTGLPDIHVFDLFGSKHIVIGGSGKAGSTQAPLLALFAAGLLGLEVLHFIERHNCSQYDAMLKNALKKLKDLERG